jgi:phospholipid/cholesterol/gamma-HCH transport system substrate-binding protein
LRGKELLVGSVIIAAISVAVVGTLWLQGTNFGRPVTPIYALLESVAQLQEGNAVTYRGVRIGRVNAISVEPGGVGVRVVLLLDQEVSLPGDAAVVLGPESLFGDWQAEIVSRSSFPGFPFYELPDVLPADTLTLGGYALPELSRLTASAEQIAQNVAELTDRLELAFNQETADNLARAIGNIEAITAEVRVLVQQQGEVAASITASADSALAEIQVASTAARHTFESMEGILTGPQVDSILANATVASDGIRSLAEAMADSTGGLAMTLTRADSAFSRLDRLTALIERGEGTIGRLLYDSTLAVRAEDVLLQLDLLLQDLRENPRRYVRLSIF